MSVTAPLSIGSFTLLRVPELSDRPRRGKIPLPGWIINLARLYVVVAVALLVYAIANDSVLIGALAVISLLFSAGFLRRFRRQR